MDQPILFFDGVCVLCSSSVEIVFRMDRKRKFCADNILDLAGNQHIDQTPTAGKKFCNADAELFNF